MIQNTLLMSPKQSFCQPDDSKHSFLRQSCNEFITAIIATVENHSIRAWRT